MMVSGILSKEGGRRCFILASDKNKKDQKICEANFTSRLLPETGRSQSNALETRNKQMDRKPPITNHERGPFELVQVNMCFLRGPLRGLTE